MVRLRLNGRHVALLAQTAAGVTSRGYESEAVPSLRQLGLPD